MRLLLGTHSFLWFITADPKLSPRADASMRDGRNRLLLSIGSIWEIAIKVSIGRLSIPKPLDIFVPKQLRANRSGLLPIRLKHTYVVSKLPLHHRDPFDLLLVAQAQTEGMPLISADVRLDDYGITRLW